MNPFLECQLLSKARKIIRRRIQNLIAFQKVLLTEEFIEAVSAADDLEESFEDILIFDISPNFRSYENSLSNEISDLDELKNEVLNELEMKISDSNEMTAEESLEILKEMTKNSIPIAEKYFTASLTTINNIKRKLTVITHIFDIDNRLKKFLKSFENYLNNLKNFPNLIAVDNANRVLIENFEHLEFLLEEIFQNPLTIADKIRNMNPAKLTIRTGKCPSQSDSDSSDGIYIDEEPIKPQPKKSSTDCFFVKKSSAEDTRVDSIAKLETNLEKLDEKIESIQDEKLALKQEICMKKRKLQEAILKVIEFEVQIEELEKLMEKNLHRFQLRIISLENRLMDNFKGENDLDMKVLLEKEINDVKSDHKKQQLEIESMRDELVKEAQSFAFSLGSDIVNDFRMYHRDQVDDLTDKSEISQKQQQFTINRNRLEKLLARPAKYCRDANGERFYVNSKKQKIYQIYPHSSEYALDNEGNRTKIQNGIPIRTDEKGEFYLDSQSCKIYTKLFFEDEYGRYYIDIHGTRHYQTDPEASEYELVDNQWIKIKDGTYETDERGLRKWPESSEESIAGNQSENYQETLSFDDQKGSKIKEHDIKYIQETVGPAIRKGLAAVDVHQPQDPVNYFANFLLHYRFTQTFFQQRDAELNYFLELRQQIKNEKCQKN